MHSSRCSSWFVPDLKILEVRKSQGKEKEKLHVQSSGCEAQIVAGNIGYRTQGNSNQMHQPALTLLTPFAIDLRLLPTAASFQANNELANLSTLIRNRLTRHKRIRHPTIPPEIRPHTTLLHQSISISTVYTPHSSQEYVQPQSRSNN
jgi:hypothetical protein